jgi:hypothetical protein
MKIAMATAFVAGHVALRPLEWNPKRAGCCIRRLGEAAPLGLSPKASGYCIWRHVALRLLELSPKGAGRCTAFLRLLELSPKGAGHCTAFLRLLEFSPISAEAVGSQKYGQKELEYSSKMTYWRPWPRPAPYLTTSARSSIGEYLGSFYLKLAASNSCILTASFLYLQRNGQPHNSLFWS